MNYFKNMFIENSGFSWRKTMTAVVLLLFAFVITGHQIVHKWEELPSNYLYLMGIVFVFYFGKEALSGFKFVSKSSKDNKDTSKANA